MKTIYTKQVDAGTQTSLKVDVFTLTIWEVVICTDEEVELININLN